MPVRPGGFRQQERNVADIGAHIVDDRAGLDQFPQGGLQLRLIGAQPVILIDLHIQQDGIAGQVARRHLDLRQSGRRGAVQPAADKGCQRLDLIDGLLEGCRQYPWRQTPQR